MRAGAAGHRPGGASSTSTRLAARAPELSGKALQGHELSEPFIQRASQILANERAIDITLVGFDHRIGIADDGRGSRAYRLSHPPIISG